VVAGAGFGKSTAIAAWSHRVGCAWYTLDREDAALAIFARGLIVALRHRVAELPLDILEASGGPGAPGAEDRSRAEALATHLSDALQERLKDDLVLVLDDLHEIDPASPAIRLVEGLCRHAPPRLHLVVASRYEIPFPIARLRSRGEVLDIGSEHLALSANEIGDLCRTIGGRCSGGLIERIHELTSGWPAAVRLALEALRLAEPARADGVLAELRRPGGPLFAFLAEEVFAREEPEVRELLRLVTPFDQFSGELCEALGIEGAPTLLAALSRRGLFVQPQGGAGGWFVLHDLMRRFVIESSPLDPRELHAIHRSAAFWFEEHGLLGEALRSLAAASEPEAIARLLVGRGDELLARGEVDNLLALGERVGVAERPPELEELLGEGYTVRGEPELAQACFRRAAGGAEDLPPRLAWRIGLMYHERGEHAQALEVYARGRNDGSRPGDEAVLLAATATTHLLIGDVERCHELCDHALASAEASGEDRAIAAAHATLMLASSGRDPQLAEEHYRQALAAARSAGDILLEVRLRTNHASQLDVDGAYRDALEELDLALRLAELAGYTERLALALNNRGWTRFHVGRLEEAIGDLQRSKALYQRAGSIRAAWPLMNLGTVYRERGDLALARTALEEALPLAESSRDVQGRVGAQANLARLVANEEPDRAAELAASAIEAGRAWGALVDAQVAAGWVALQRGDPERAVALAREARREAMAFRNRPGLAESLELEALAVDDPARAITHLKEAISIWREIGNPLGETRSELALAQVSSGPGTRAAAERAERRLREMGVRLHAAAGAAGLLAAIPRANPLSVQIRTLGGFRVLRKGEPVAKSEWHSKKARDLVKILVTRRGRPVPREALMETLWPEEDPEPLAKRLSVALSTARTVLDPERRFPNDSYIAGDDDAVWIDLAHVSVDVEEFLTEATAGLALARRGRSQEAREVLAAAESSYAGDFLEEDLYEEWAIALREEARATYISVTRALALAASAAGEEWGAVSYRLRILERDPYDEDAHLGLVAAHSRVGRHGEARRLYRTYVAWMEDLGIEPAPFPPLDPSHRISSHSS
jgi:DNA-binding SARP family transcriptional activator/Tfp pilus assembly protein PilF